MNEDKLFSPTYHVTSKSISPLLLHTTGIAIFNCLCYAIHHLIYFTASLLCTVLQKKKAVDIFFHSVYLCNFESSLESG